MTVVQIVFLAFAIATGLVLGWIGRGKRARQEKAAINAGWKEQLDALRIEQKRLLKQSKGLMEQIGEHQASGKDATNRARELSSALKEAFERRDQLQREIKEIRSKLEVTIADRRRLETDVRSLEQNDSSRSAAIREKDDKIFRLSRELESWHERLPPLIERFKERDADVKRLDAALECANGRIAELEGGPPADLDETRAEAVDTGSLSNALDASNDASSEDGTGHEANGLDASGRNADDIRMARFTDHDDLKAIKGVGPAIEKTLHELGFFRYSQIAEMSEYDIDRVARRLRGFRSRIYREDWIGQARALLHGYSAEPH